MITTRMCRDVLGWHWEQEVERKMGLLLLDYKEYLLTRGEQLRPPYSVETIATGYLRLDLDILPLKNRFPHVPVGPDDQLLGAMDRESEDSNWTIYLDQGLEETGREGRINFTMAHEIAHYVFDLTDEEKSFGSAAGRITPTGSHTPRIFCRTSDSETPIERRADYAAACLLAPSSGVKARSKRWAKRQGFVAEGAVKPMQEHDWRSMADCLADEFGTSWTAMRRRIYEVGLYREYRDLWVA